MTASAINPEDQHGIESGNFSLDRKSALAELSSQVFDVIVVGGGITGAGVALDAVTRGLRTALVERADFASGTSSKSSKLIHGGLRYLQQGDIRLVYEALRERKRLRRNAPHLVRVLPFMIPILTKDGLISRKISRALGSALWMYDLTGGWRIGKLHRRLNKRNALSHFPTMDSRRLASAYLYYDAEADDARLCVAVLRTAVDHGAVIANYSNVTAISRDENGLFELVINDTVSGETRIARARSVVNAGGVWADDIRALDEGTHPDTIRPAKGVHLTVSWDKVRNDIAVVIPVPKDRRSLFVIPWIPNGDGTYRYTYVGTTDTDYAGSIDEPQCSSDDIDYVLTALNASVTTGITRDDVVAVWSGLRPLVKPSADARISGRTADLSRRHSVTRSSSGVITVTGGKLTTYREMAEDTVDLVMSTLGRRSRCKTRTLRIHGAQRISRTQTSTPTFDHLASRYGSDATIVGNLMSHGDGSLAGPLVPGLPYVMAEAVYAVTHEMAHTLDDILSRRTRARLLDREASVRAAREVARTVAPFAQWDEQRIDREVRDYVDSCAREAAATKVSESEFTSSTTFESGSGQA